MTMNLVIAIPAFVLLFLAASVEAFAIDAAGACSRPRTLARVASSSTPATSEGGGASSSTSSSSSSSSPSPSPSPAPLDVSPYMSGPRPEGTEDFVMQQTMIRVKDPRKSLDFYCNVLGFKLIHYSEASPTQNHDSWFCVSRCIALWHACQLSSI